MIMESVKQDKKIENFVVWGENFYKCVYSFVVLVVFCGYFLCYNN